LINCLDIGVGIEGARTLSYWEYTAVLTEWNNRRKAEQTNTSGADSAPSKERVRKNRERLIAAGVGQARPH
jgi:hypothetical protein